MVDYLLLAVHLSFDEIDNLGKGDVLLFTGAAIFIFKHARIDIAITNDDSMWNTN